MKSSVPWDAHHRVRAALSAEPDVTLVMLTHGGGDEPTMFKPGVLEIVLDGEAREERIEQVRNIASRALGRYAAFVPIVCGSPDDLAGHPLVRGGGNVVFDRRRAW